MPAIVLKIAPLRCSIWPPASPQTTVRAAGWVTVKWAIAADSALMMPSGGLAIGLPVRRSRRGPAAAEPNRYHDTALSET